MDGYCHDVERSQKLFRKHRFEVEKVVSSELQNRFFTNTLGMSDYHLMEELPAKLIKIAGIKGFLSIAREHPLIMTNCKLFKRVEVRKMLI